MADEKLPSEKLVTLKLQIPEDLRNAFKGACAVQGKTMRDVVIAAMQTYVEAAQPPKDS